MTAKRIRISSLIVLGALAIAAALNMPATKVIHKANANSKDTEAMVAKFQREFPLDPGEPKVIIHRKRSIDITANQNTATKE